MIGKILVLMSVAFIILFSLMTLVWWIQKKMNNAGIVDIVWGLSFPISSLLYFLISGNFTNRNFILLAMVFCWGIRLAFYLFGRNWGKPEDGRYANLRKEWGDKTDVKMFLFFQFQALLSVLLSLPFVLIFLNTTNSFSALEIIGSSIWLIGITGETIADNQLKHFKSKSANIGKVCNEGLWYFSRHPNYFFEWTIWVAYFIFALASPYGWASFVSPLLMLHFLINVTGIKYSEEHMLATKGEPFRIYIETTSAFIPLPKKSNL